MSTSFTKTHIILNHCSNTQSVSIDINITFFVFCDNVRSSHVIFICFFSLQDEKIQSFHSIKSKVVVNFSNISIDFRYV
jgi:hypothetical protein